MSAPVRIMAVGMLTLLLGLHWGLIQSMAWTGMLVERAQTGSLWQAVRTTFDGKHPCRLCLAVRDARLQSESAAESREGQRLPQWKLVNLDVVSPETGLACEWVRLEGKVLLTGRSEEACTPWEEAPESPPPRQG